MSGYDIFAWIVLVILLASAIGVICMRYVAPGQEVEATFKFAPGQIFAGKVESVLQAMSRRSRTSRRC